MDIKTTKQVVNLLDDQRIPIMLRGVHGIGKSEVLTEIFESKGYRVETIFVGQAADTGDIIGLQKTRRIKVKKLALKDESYFKTEIIQTSNGFVENRNELFATEDTEYFDEDTETVYSLPYWWPRYVGEKVALFFDEVNRGKPEILQALMDLTLNYKICGQKLPESVKVISACNPNDDQAMYDVTDFDPAFFDRYAVYDFTPSPEEWIQWALKTDLDSNVIDFISKNEEYLDCPTGKEYKVNTVNPSRRSWHRVSKIFKARPELKQNDDLMRSTLNGLVGHNAASKFSHYLKTSGNGITPGMIFLQWDKELEDKVTRCDVQVLVNMNSIALSYIRKEYPVWKDLPKHSLRKYIGNFEKYLDVCPLDVVADFLKKITPFSKEDWCKWFITEAPTLSKRMVEAFKSTTRSL